MNSSIAHIQLNVSSKRSLSFYKELLTFLNFKILHEWPTGFGAEKDDFSIWMFLADEKYAKKGFHRKNVGLNHLAFKVGSKRSVDTFVKDFLKPKGIKTLYGAPKAYPEYTKDYYAVFFEDPDRLKLEIAHYS